MFDSAERRYLDATRVARLATADDQCQPHAVPICFALVDDVIVTPIDEKPKRAKPNSLRRVRDIEQNDSVALVADHYVEDWERLGWVQVRGRAAVRNPDANGRRANIDALREKYDQYVDHELEMRPLIRITPKTVRSWGELPASG